MKNSKSITPSFSELATKNPCEGCPAPCCKMQILPAVLPQNLMAVDHMRYSLLFPNTEFTFTRNMEFSLVKWVTCQLFEEKKCICSVHNTPKKPLTCVHYNPYNCWYKRNFVTSESPDICRLNLKRFERWAEEIKFKDEQVIALPSFDEAKALVQGIPIHPSFRLDPGLKKEQQQELVGSGEKYD